MPIYGIIAQLVTVRAASGLGAMIRITLAEVRGKSVS